MIVLGLHAPCACGYSACHGGSSCKSALFAWAHALLIRPSANDLILVVRAWNCVCRPSQKSLPRTKKAVTPVQTLQQHTRRPQLMCQVIMHTKHHPHRGREFLSGSKPCSEQHDPICKWSCRSHGRGWCSWRRDGRRLRKRRCR